MIADFAIRGRLAYLSHQETLTMFQRSLLRAGVPVAFSGGFNPRLRVSLPLPRSVGTQSCAERLCAVLSTDRPLHPQDIRRPLETQLPEDCTLGDVWCAEGKCSFHASVAHYIFTLVETLTDDRRAFLTGCREDVKAERRIEVQRYHAKKKIHQPFDISSFIEDVRFSENQIEVSCRIRTEGTVRIDELMQWLGLEAGQLKEPVNRTEIQWI